MNHAGEAPRDGGAAPWLRMAMAAGVALSISTTRAEFFGTGGTITVDGEYFVHTFTNAVDTFTVTGSGEVEVLLVGGGGGGGAYGGGGGGGGQVVSNKLTLASDMYAITVGAGGRGAISTSDSSVVINSQAESGGDTHAFGLVAKGGGAGGSVGDGFSGANGGGGGVAKYATNPADDIVKYGGAPLDPDAGHAGGSSLQPAGLTHFYQAAGGGGGAGGIGGDAIASQAPDAADNGVEAGNGGKGVTNSISGVALGYGGGGGGGCSAGSRGAGSDGGGDGGTGRSAATLKAGQPGRDGTGGGGGGGGRYVKTTADGGNGGCGIVIVRYRPTYPDFFGKVEVSGNYAYRKKRIGDATYGIYTFTNDATVVLTGTSYADLLLVGGGGGGGGGRCSGGGGGGGGVVYREHVMVIGGTYSVVVGNGGPGARPKEGNGRDVWAATNGCATTAFGLTALGGGAGGSNGYSGSDGASGGGGSVVFSTSDEASRLGGEGVFGQGNSGGSSAKVLGANTRVWSGGGGGAGCVGADAVRESDTSGFAGKGGDGVVCSITGQEVYYGGGGGGGYGDYTAGSTVGSTAGGQGGGGAGSGRAAPVSNDGLGGVDGLGGGGGGGGASNTSAIEKSGCGGKGGCGVVILRVREHPCGLIMIWR